MIHIEEILNKLKELSGVSSDAQIARILHLKPDALFQRQKRNSIPHDNVIKYCLDNKISIDSLYSNVNASKEIGDLSMSHSRFGIKNIKIYDSDEYISIPVNNFENKKIVATIDTENRTIHLVDTETKDVQTDGLYFVAFNGKKVLKNFQTTFQNTVIVSDATGNQTNNFEITIEQLSEIEIVGKSVQKIMY